MQSALVAGPLWNRAALPEPDDIYPYIVRARQIDECFYQDCPALEDLRKQVLQPYEDSKADRARVLGAGPFHIYHPLFSFIQWGVKHAFDVDYATAYKLMWQAAPLLFGIAIACLLYTLWGAPAAAAALFLLAFKVFPDTGLHYLAPSNTALACGMAVWARIISRRGDAPSTIFIGSIILALIHPMGLIYALMAAVIAVAVSEPPRPRKMWYSIFSVAAVFGAVWLSPALIDRPHLAMPDFFPHDREAIFKIITGAASSIVTVLAVQVIRYEEALFGSVALFAGAAVLGFVRSDPHTRRIALRVTGVCGVFLLASSLHVLSHPGDLLLRVWIPLVIVLYGAVGSAIHYSVRETGKVTADLIEGREPWKFSVGKAWAPILLALFVGYSYQMIMRGLEHLVVTRQYMEERQPLRFEPSQPAMLMSEAEPGDRVAYTNAVVMEYYFSRGAMQLGAVYYHPALEGTVTDEWIRRPDVKFVVGYAPTVYHPSYRGREEKKWWRTSPDLRYSPLSTLRRHRPVGIEGAIETAEFKRIMIETADSTQARTLRILVKNSRGRTMMKIRPAAPGRVFPPAASIEIPVPPRWSGPLIVDLTPLDDPSRFVLELPYDKPGLRITGITFGKDRLRWPWNEKARLTFFPGDPTEPISVVRFDAESLVPPPLRDKTITVLNDIGSSTLIGLSDTEK